MKKLRYFILLAGLIIVKITGDNIYLYVPSEYTTGTDSACEAYQKEIDKFHGYKNIYITNQDWTPGPKHIIN